MRARAWRRRLRLSAAANRQLHARKQEPEHRASTGRRAGLQRAPVQVRDAAREIQAQPSPDEAAPARNVSNKCGIASGRIPGPWSAMSTSAQGPPGWSTTEIATFTGLPCGECFTALAITFASA